MRSRDEVMRYSPFIDEMGGDDLMPTASMYKHKQGAWVKYEDYSRMADRLRELEAQQAASEPVAWVRKKVYADGSHELLVCSSDANGSFPVYTYPSAAAVAECERCAAVDAALLAVCRDNTAEAIGEPDPELGRYLLLNENGDELIDTDDPCEVIARISEMWDIACKNWERAEARANADEPPAPVVPVVTEAMVEAAAKALFLDDTISHGMTWDDASPRLVKEFKAYARIALTAALTAALTRPTTPTRGSDE